MSGLTTTSPAIRSAKHLFGERNVVLLPDSLMTLSDNHAPLSMSIYRALYKTGFCFFHKHETDHNMLETKGALLVDDKGEVHSYEDKPSDTSFFNGYWCGFAFFDDVFSSAIAFMERSTLHEEQTIDIKDTPIYGCRTIPVKEYRDLGTWPEIRRWTSGS